MQELSVRLFCPHCGQKLLISTLDLRHQFRCPRCQAVEEAGALIPPQRTVPGVPIEAARDDAVPAEAPMQPWTPSRDLVVPFEPTPMDTMALRVEPPAVVAAAPAPAAIVAVAKRASWPLRGARVVLHVAEWFDRKSYGKRLTVLYVLSALYCLSAAFSAIHGSTLAESLGLIPFGTVLALYGLARISFFRNEDGEWTWRTAIRGLRGAWGRGLEAIGDWRTLPRAERSAQTASFLMMLGCMGLAVRAIVVRVVGPGEVLFVCAVIGWILFAVGVYRWYTLRDLRKALTGPRMLLPPSAPAVLSGLPEIIDLVRNAEQEVAYARAKYGPYLARLVESLAKWDPRPRGEPLEADYHASLHRHLRKVWPEIRIAREMPLHSIEEGVDRRVDLAIDGYVLLEIKRRLKRSTEMDRAISQIRAYAKAWDQKPVLLVVCESGADFADGRGLRAKVRELRRVGYPIVAIAAGRRARA